MTFIEKMEGNNFPPNLQRYWLGPGSNLLGFNEYRSVFGARGPGAREGIMDTSTSRDRSDRSVKPRQKESKAGSNSGYTQHFQDSPSKSPSEISQLQEIFHQPTALEQICRNLSLEDAINMRNTLKLPVLTCTFQVRENIDHKIITFNKVDDETIYTYGLIKKLGLNRALIEAAKNGYHQIVQFLLKAGANTNTFTKANIFEIDIYDTEGKTALMVASEKGHLKTVQILLDAGADPNLKNNLQITALKLAAKFGHDQVVQALLQAGAEIRSDVEFLATPLMLAAEGGHASVVRTLIKAGADVNEFVNEETTALIQAAKNGHDSVVRILLDEGATSKVHKQYHFTPLGWAVMNNHKSTVEILLQSGIHPSTINKSTYIRANSDIINLLKSYDTN